VGRREEAQPLAGPRGPLSDGGAASDGGSGADGGCVSDFGCLSPGPRCNPRGNNQIGTCVDVGGGCVNYQNPVTCPSTLQTCPVGATACSCPTSSCAVGVDRACAGDGTLVTCAYDLPNGCGVYPGGGGAACPSPQTCKGSAPTAACTCPAAGTTVGAGCPAPDSTICSSNGTLVCAHGDLCNVWQLSIDGGCPSTACPDIAGSYQSCIYCPGVGQGIRPKWLTAPYHRDHSDVCRRAARVTSSGVSTAEVSARAWRFKASRQLQVAQSCPMQKTCSADRHALYGIYVRANVAGADPR
jgi:hypothetical protein